MRAIGLEYADSYFHYVVLGDAGEVVSRGAVRANQDDLRREFRAFEPTCIAMNCCRMTRWAAELLTRLHHAVHVDSRLILSADQLALSQADQEADISAELAVSKAEAHARRVRNQWTRGVAAMRAAAMETAIYA
jgi:hypothetical protein